MATICEPTEHAFVVGGDGANNEKGEDSWEAWLYCENCGAIAMVPTDAHKGATILAPETDGQAS